MERRGLEGRPGHRALARVGPRGAAHPGRRAGPQVQGAGTSYGPTVIQPVAEPAIAQPIPIALSPSVIRALISFQAAGSPPKKGDIS